MMMQLAVRYLLYWAMLRASVTLVGLLGGVAFTPSPGFSLRFALLFGLVAFFDERRRGERVLLANLGTSMATVVGGSMVVALTAELLLGILLTSYAAAVSR